MISLGFGLPHTADGITVVRQQANGTVSWARKHNIWVVVQSLIENPSETWVYYKISYESQGDYRIVRMNATDGVIDAFKTNNGHKASVRFSNGVVIPDGSGGDYVYSGGWDPTSSQGNVCRFSFDANTIECVKFPDIFESTRTISAIDSGKVFLTGVDSGTPNQYRIKLIEFGTPSPEWAYDITCPFPPCAAQYSQSMVNSTENSLLLVASFGQGGSTTIFKFNLTDGGLLGDKLHLPDCSAKAKARVKGKEVFMIAYCYGSYVLIQIDTVENQIVDYAQRDSDMLYSFYWHPTDGEFVATGRINTPYSAYKAKAAFEHFKYFPRFENTDQIRITIYSSGSTEFSLVSSSTSTSAMTYDSLADFSYSASYETDATFEYDSSLALTTTISYNLEQENLKATLNSYGKLNVTLSCASDGISSTSFVLNTYSTYPQPDWVELNPTNQQILSKAPNTTGDFYFSIDTLVTGWESPRQKIVKITVSECQVSNCTSCLAHDYDKCSECADGYEVNDEGGCAVKQVQGYVRDAAKISQGVSTAGVVLSVASTFMNSSSLTAIWLIINQIQLLMLFMFFHVSKDIAEYLTSSFYVIAPFNLIPLTLKLSPFEGPDFEQENENLRKMGIESTSTVINSFGLLQSLGFLVLCHMVVYLLTFVTFSDPRSWWSKAINFCINNGYSLLTFSIYVRVILEGYLFLIISSVEEIYAWNHSTPAHLASFYFAGLAFCCCIGMIIASYWHYKTNVNQENDQSKFRELYAGLKPTTNAWAYSSVWVLRRLVFVTIIISLKSLPPVPKVSILFSCQVLYMTYLVVIRPFEQTRQNLIELVNEGVFITLLAGQFYYNEESKWSDSTTERALWVLGFNNVAVVSIVFIAFCYDLVGKCYKPKDNETRVAPETKINRDVTAERPSRSHIGCEGQFGRSKISAYYMNSAIELEEVKHAS